MSKLQNSQEKMKELTDKLEEGIKELYQSEKYRNYLITMAKFHNYSYRNVALITMQKPDATKIAGYNAWKSKFNRQVKKGEKGIQILAPARYKTKVEVEKIDPVTQKPIKDSTGQIVKELIEIEKPYFRSVYVFDISQTEGEPLPELINELTGNVEQYNIFFPSLQKVSPYPIEFEDMTGKTKGYCNYFEGRIAIKNGMDEKQNIKTAIHEITHATLHTPNITFPPEPEEKRATRETREVEAESVAFIVCEHYGINTSDYSFGYIASWSSDKELTELKNSLTTIQETAKKLIDK